ncbi:MAG TPA: NAD+ synthase [Terriglobia bacterium]|nr:NAD+ synthase [Terriglobia bacterium]
MTAQHETALRVALVQANPTVGDFAGNLDKLLTYCRQNRDADLIVFPECYLSGYPLEDLVLRQDFLTVLHRHTAMLAERIAAEKLPTVLVGLPLNGTDLPFNAAHLISQEGIVHSILKNELPNEDVFDERRIFDHGHNPKPMPFGDWRLGAMICEDMWHGNVTRALVDELIDCLIVINGSPYEIDKLPVRLNHARERVRRAGKPLLYLNMVGGQDELVLDGGSFALDRHGKVVAQLPAFHEAVMRVTLRKREGVVEIAPDDAANAVTEYPERLEAIYTACVLGLRDYIEKNRFPHVMLGVSGGLDSALVAAMAVDAIGKDRVYGFMLPARFTGSLSLDLARDLFARLGCRHHTIAIEAPHRAVEAQLADVTAQQLFKAARPEDLGLAAENLQPRLRGMLLMAISNAYGGLVLSTGNKSEMSVGYATLYGDMCGGFNPIKDLYKTTAFELCRWRNRVKPDWVLGGTEPIPEAIISRPPTAELRPDQTDESALGSYDHLDTVLRLLIEGQHSPIRTRELASARLGHEVSQDYVEKVARLVKRAEYKRRQAPPGVKLTSKSFGKGWRYPITNRAEL